MTHLVLFLEEPSAEEMLRGLLPRILPTAVSFQCVVFEGKQDLEKRLEGKLRAWNIKEALFAVLRDQDGAACKAVKKKLVEICLAADRPQTLVRVACHELESWYLADLTAVEQGLKISGLQKLQGKKKYRVPDNLANPAQELERLTGNVYQKVSGSRAIGPYLSPDNNRSTSFMNFITGIRSLVQTG